MPVNADGHHKCNSILIKIQSIRVKNDTTST